MSQGWPVVSVNTLCPICRKSDRCKVAPDSKAVRCFRSSEPPTPITPGKIHEYEIDMRSTSYVFKRSHRIRLEISSSNFPNYAPNPNTGHLFGADAAVAPADQTVFHDSRYPSRLVLPLIPR